VVNSEGRVKFRIVRTQSSNQLASVSGQQSLLKRRRPAHGSATPDPLDEGFHYYTINIDGADVPDPNSHFFYGAGRWGSAVEIPAKTRIFTPSKMLPHGELRELWYFFQIRPTPTVTPSFTPHRITTKAAAKRYPASLSATRRG